MRQSEMKTVYGLVGATLALALVCIVGVSNYESRQKMELLQTPQFEELAASHYVAPNPFEDPVLRAPYDVDVKSEEGKSKKDFEDASKEVAKGFKIMKAVLKDLESQDEARDKLMDQGVAIADRIHSVRHLLIMMKSEVAHIQTNEDGNWIFTNPFGEEADPPAQKLKPFQTNMKELTTKCEAINKDLKALIVKTRASRIDAIMLDAKLYDEVHKAKLIAKAANVEIHHHRDRVEMFNHEDFDVIHRIDNKLNDKYRTDRARLRGMFNLAKDMSARQPNEVSEVTALATDLLIVNAETLERLGHMGDKMDSIKYERGYRAGGSSSASS